MKFKRVLIAIVVTFLTLFAFSGCSSSNKKVSIDIYTCNEKGEKGTIIKTLDSQNDINYYLEVVNKYQKTEKTEMDCEPNFILYIPKGFENGDDAQYVLYVTDKEIYFTINENNSSDTNKEFYLSQKDKDYFLSPMLSK